MHVGVIVEMESMKDFVDRQSREEMRQPVVRMTREPEGQDRDIPSYSRDDHVVD